MKKDSEKRVCKKCQKELPAGYKYKCCEACRNKQVQAIKDGVVNFGKGVLAVGGFVGTVAVAVFANKKINQQEEEEKEEDNKENEESV